MSPLTLVVQSHAHLKMAVRTGGVERCLVTFAVLACVLLVPTLGSDLLGALEDAYLGVGVFVAATFALFFALEGLLKIDTVAWMNRHQRWEVPVAAALGALPGCGGAVMVTTQFAMRRASFGAVVAVLTATMGDAAFLILAQKPTVGLFLMGVGLVSGVVSGYVVNLIHGRSFLQVDRPVKFEKQSYRLPVPGPLWGVWAMFCVPGLVMGVLLLFQVEIPSLWTAIVGIGGGALSIIMWALSPTQSAHMAAIEGKEPFTRRVALNTNFVTVWVVLAFFLFEFVGGEAWLKPMLEVAPAIYPLAGVLVGFLPGCGPQILVATLYLAGIVPMSAQLGNAISNDGDALFPAIAVVPRAALVATIYTAVPALIVGYGYFWLVETAA